MVEEKDEDVVAELLVGPFGVLESAFFCSPFFLVPRPLSPVHLFFF